MQLPEKKWPPEWIIKVIHYRVKIFFISTKVYEFFCGLKYSDPHKPLVNAWNVI